MNKRAGENNNEHQPYSAPGLQTLSDVELAKALVNGCNDALAILFERYSRLVFHIARNMLKDEGEAEEAVQQVFFDLFRAIRQFQPERGSFKTWLLQFAYHRAINRLQHLQSNRFYNLEELNEGLMTGVTHAPHCAHQFEPQEIDHFIRQMLNTLKPRQRRVIELIFFEGLKPEEIASILGRKAANVRHDLYRGLSVLRRVFVEPSRAGEHGGHACGDPQLESSACRKTSERQWHKQLIEI